MEIIACSSLPIASIKMTIAEMHNDGSHTTICEHKSTLSGFSVPIPKHVAKKLKVDNIVTVICIPNKDLTFATETLGLTLHTSDTSSEQIYDRNNYHDMMR